MSGVEELVRDYGYWIILVGTYFDHYGIPLFLVFGGIASSQEVLSLNGVLFCGFAGGWIADLFLYFLGYKTGLHYWMQFSFVRKLSSPIESVNKIFRNHPAAIIILGRFLFAVSKFIPPFAGMIRYNIRNYFLYSFVGNILFSTSYTLASHFAGSWIIDTQTGLKFGNAMFALIFLGSIILLIRNLPKSSVRI